ncbi:hypothetical protein RI129_007131 [Pyrocoelia pectoralis]|uniref:RHD domain-containing protein n=1 Tax=Pyrocoelia pectoralis TaxID=417401 RepID=A0AAN7VD27_9COLE
MDDHGLESPQHPVGGVTDDNLNISDVIEVIATDPDFDQSRSVFNGVPEPTRSPVMAQMRPRVRIIEQPASKALRFRYECEGRSAGSIPGVSSTPENKTFPAIQIVGYQGRAVVVVSCVTKDLPHRPHPHNLVGREGCKKGVCTLEVSPDTMSVTFSNLGIQCVKKKDIESALKVREEIRVDPFRTGFAHRNQPTSIDLNAVRLCFQVFLEGERGKFTVPLTPVVSEPIYDKKAMCDLVIVKLSDCTSSVAGGTKDVILLCEKVSKEDIEIRFYEEKDGQVVWEGRGDFQPSQVHKQTAIWFKTPPYKRLDVTEPVKVFIQLRRPSDTATSEPLPFELLPLDAGRPAFWSFRRNLAKKGNYNLFSSILANDTRPVTKTQTVPMNSITENKIAESVETEIIVTESEPITQSAIEWCDYSEVDKCSKESESKEDKCLNDLINEVAELDEIYSESRMRATPENLGDDKTPGDFDDTRTYTSLQMAFKNTLEIDISDKLDNTTVISPQSPLIDIVTLKRENEIDKLPPLPPKRQKKLSQTYVTRSYQIQILLYVARTNPSLVPLHSPYLVHDRIMMLHLVNGYLPHRLLLYQILKSEDFSQSYLRERRARQHLLAI